MANKTVSLERIKAPKEDCTGCFFNRLDGCFETREEFECEKLDNNGVVKSYIWQIKQNQKQRRRK